MSAFTNAASKVVVVIGAGPGTGFAIAKRFASAGHPVALLARQQSRLDALVQEINSDPSNGRARAFSADASSKASVDAAFEKISQEFAPAGVFGAVFNASMFHMASVLDTKEEMVHSLVDGTLKGGFWFTQAYLRALTARQDWDSVDAGQAAGFLAYTGATASLKGGAAFPAFAAAQAGLRSLAQSTARGWTPKGVHVFHTIVDGFIDTENVAAIAGKPAAPDSRLKPDDIAQVYYDVATQKRSTWTHELDIRPFSETF
ncbi:unnamed protein product [Parajaminaea phylloscopi]